MLYFARISLIYFTDQRATIQKKRVPGVVEICIKTGPTAFNTLQFQVGLNNSVSSDSDSEWRGTLSGRVYMPWDRYRRTIERQRGSG